MAKYYYNGVLLPEIPEDVLAEYPYAWIRNNTTSGYYDLLLSDVPFYCLLSGASVKEGNLVVGKPWYRVPIATAETATAWENNTSNNTFSGWGIDSARTVLWSNHDIPNGSATSTTIYFYGSEPVPETPSFDKKYLIRSNSTLYTITDGTLTALAEPEITADLFQTYGVDEIPDGALLVGLTDPEVLYWHDSEDELPELTLTVNGLPPVPQIVVTNTQDMSDPSILGIESATVDASDDVLFAMSFDDGTTWKAYNGTQWLTLSTENSGMTKSTMENISVEAWAQVVTSQSYKIRFALMDAKSYVSSVRINYIN